MFQYMNVVNALLLSVQVKIDSFNGSSLDQVWSWFELASMDNPKGVLCLFACLYCAIVNTCFDVYEDVFVSWPKGHLFYIVKE